MGGIKRIKSGEIDLNLVFNEDKANMPMERLRTEFTDKIDDYEVVHLNVDALTEYLEPGNEDRYPIGELIIDCHTWQLIDLIKSGEKIIPPILRFVGDKCVIMDGQHRFSIIRYLKLKNAPFLVLKSDLNTIKKTQLGI